MGTTHTTKQTAQFDPTSMSAFQGLTPAWANTAKGFIQNPFSNPQFQLEQQLGTRQAQNLGQTGTSDIVRNFLGSGIGGGGAMPFQQEMLANQARANTGLQAQLGFIQPMLNALQRQQYSMGLAQGYHPLQTGQTTRESTGGLGTWLPQVAGLAMAPFTGGTSLLGTMGSMFANRGGSSMPSGGWAGSGGMAPWAGGGGDGSGGGGGMMPFLGGNPSGSGGGVGAMSGMPMPWLMP